MPQIKIIEKAKRALRKGKSPSTAAGEFIRDEMERIGDGKQDERARKRAVAVGLAKARRAGIPLRPQPETPADKRSRAAVQRAFEAGQKQKKKSPKKKRASSSQRTTARKRAGTAARKPRRKTS